MKIMQVIYYSNLNLFILLRWNLYSNQVGMQEAKLVMVCAYDWMLCYVRTNTAFICAYIYKYARMCSRTHIYITRMREMDGGGELGVIYIYQNILEEGFMVGAEGVWYDYVWINKTFVGYIIYGLYVRQIYPKRRKGVRMGKAMLYYTRTHTRYV